MVLRGGCAQQPRRNAILAIIHNYSVDYSAEMNFASEPCLGVPNHIYTVQNFRNLPINYPHCDSVVLCLVNQLTYVSCVDMGVVRVGLYTP